MELKRLRSLFVLKHQQLSEATARVEALTQQLADKSQGVPFEEILEGKEKTRGVKNGYQVCFRLGVTFCNVYRKKRKG